MLKIVEWAISKLKVKQRVDIADVTYANLVNEVRDRYPLVIGGKNYSEAVKITHCTNSSFEHGCVLSGYEDCVDMYDCIKTSLRVNQCRMGINSKILGIKAGSWKNHISIGTVKTTKRFLNVARFGDWSDDDINADLSLDTIENTVEVGRVSGTKKVICYSVDFKRCKRTGNTVRILNQDGILFHIHIRVPVFVTELYFGFMRLLVKSGLYTK